MKKVWVIKGVVETTFCGDECEVEDLCHKSLKQLVDNLEVEAFSSVTFKIANNECDIPDDQYDQPMFCCQNDGTLGSTENTVEDYFEQQQVVSPIIEELEGMGWEFDEDFDRDLANVLKTYTLLD